jgi:hypothetical protein
VFLAVPWACLVVPGCVLPSLGVLSGALGVCLQLCNRPCPAPPLLLECPEGTPGTPLPSRRAGGDNKEQRKRGEKRGRDTSRSPRAEVRTGESAERAAMQKLRIVP